MSDEPPRRSLKDEIQKRKTQEMLRAIESKTTQTAPPRGTGPLSLDTPPKRQTGSLAGAEPKRTTQTIVTPPARPIWASRKALIAVAAALLTSVVCISTLALTATTATPPTSTLATPIVLPKVRALEAVNYLKRAGMPVTGLRAFPMPGNIWQASEELQFNVEHDNSKGIFVILSYDTTGRLAGDVMTVLSRPNFQNWTYTTISNLL